MDWIAKKMERLRAKLEDFTDVSDSADVIEVEPGVYECQSDDWTPVWREDWRNGISRDRWITFNPTWLGRKTFWFNPANVTTCRDPHSPEGRHYASLCTVKQKPHPSDPCFKSAAEGAGDGNCRDSKVYGTSFLRSQIQYLYGRLEADVEPSRSAVSSAFWTVCEQRGNSPGYKKIPNLAGKKWEADVFELSTSKQNNQDHSCEFHTNLHVFDPTKEPQDKQKPRKIRLDKCTHPDLPECTNKQFHVAFEWSPNKLVWEVNGVKVREENDGFCHLPMWIQFDMEILGWFGHPCDEDCSERCAAEFKVHEVVLFQKKGMRLYDNNHFDFNNCSKAKIPMPVSQHNHAMGHHH